MKKVISIVLVLIMLLTLCACETRQQKANREINEAREAYEKAHREVLDLESELEEVQQKINQAKGN